MVDDCDGVDVEVEVVVEEWWGVSERDCVVRVLFVAEMRIESEGRTLGASGRKLAKRVIQSYY